MKCGFQELYFSGSGGQPTLLKISSSQISGCSHWRKGNKSSDWMGAPALDSAKAGCATLCTLPVNTHSFSTASSRRNLRRMPSIIRGLTAYLPAENESGVGDIGTQWAPTRTNFFQMACRRTHPQQAASPSNEMRVQAAVARSCLRHATRSGLDWISTGKP